MSSRVLRAGLRSSEAINSLHDKTYRLWTHLLLAADDYGLVELGYGSIRECAPLQSWDKETVAKMVGELVDAGLLLPYQVDGVTYGALNKFQTKINSTKPRCPIPTWALTHCIKPFGFKDKATRIAATKLLNHLDLSDISDSGTLAVPERHTSGTTGGAPAMNQQTTSDPPVPEGVKGVKNKNKDRANFSSGTASGELVGTNISGSGQGSRLPQGWSLPDDWHAWAMHEAKAKGKPVPASTVSDWGLQFADYWQAVPGTKGKKLDWLATWRNAVRDLYLAKAPKSSTESPFAGGI
jgi:hypothetical protein